MITKFSYTTQADDIYEFYDFWLKQRRFGRGLYILGLIWLVPVAFAAISSNAYFGLVLSAVAIGAVIGVSFLSIKSKTKKDIGRLIKFDKTYLCKTQFTLYENAMEMQTDAPEGEVQVTEIYPFELISGIYETPRHFYLIFVGKEAKVIPKSSIPKDSAEKLSEKVMKNPAYKFISQEKK